ncbi:MAG: sigma 54-interacting transcriptional regulator [Peptostreptococcus sp.]|uniref:sigma-54-dependent Fis family transcriptional regulator n=1 Tax=Peptostreptococcus sp. TaxID=1262 RepID=UPI002FC7A27A
MKLDVIKKEIQKVAEAISLVINIDVTIVNEDMKRIAGTGIYKDKIDEIIPGTSAFNKCYEEKKTLVIDDPRNSVLCKHCYKLENCREEAEVCCPIVFEGKCFGVIGLIAFDGVQKNKITDNQKELVMFIEKMASLISGNLKAEIKSYQYNIEKEKILKVVDSMDRPLVSTDENGTIDSCNSKFKKTFKIEENPIGKEISLVLDFINADVFASLKNNKKHSATFYSERSNVRGIYNINKIYYKKDLKGFVIDFVDKKDAIRNYNKMNIDYKMTMDDIIGESKIMKKVKETALKASQSTSTILITGESGTGKELFARAIHFHSDRGDKPFIALNCAAIPEELLESELFGYEEGAFTGAKKGGKLGMFERANKGTIFLDEIGDMSIHLQAKLLRVLQEKEIQKVGGKSGIKIDVRIISATNKNLLEMVEKGMFREDLYYRLNVLPINIPNLSERKEDIPLLVNHMVKVYSQKLGKNVCGVSNHIMKILEMYNWPGNIRELQNVIEFCINMTNEKIISDVEILKNRFSMDEQNEFIEYLEDKGYLEEGEAQELNRYDIDIRGYDKRERNIKNVKPDLADLRKDGYDDLNKINKVENIKMIENPGVSARKNIKEKESINFKTIEELEVEEISRALEYYKPYKNDKDMVADVLGISRATLYRKIKKYNLDI